METINALISALPILETWAWLIVVAVLMLGIFWIFVVRSMLRPYHK